MPARPLLTALLLALVLALASGGAVACAADVGTTQLALPRVDSMAPPGAGRVGVVPLRDERPELQREGSKPWVWPLILVNWRIGDWVTSDEVLTGDAEGGDVALVISRGLSQSLGGGRFGRAELLPGGSGSQSLSVSDRCRRDDLDYVAAGSLSDFYGTVKQRSYFAILPIPFIWLIGFSNDKSDPQGIANLTLQIFDCRAHRLVYRRQLVSQRRYPDESMTDAANGAFHDVLEQLTNETR